MAMFLAGWLLFFRWVSGKKDARLCSGICDNNMWLLLFYLWPPVFLIFQLPCFSPPQRISAAAKGSVLVIHHLKVPVNKLYEWMIHSGTKCKQILCKLLSVFMFKRGASSLIHQPVSHWSLTGFLWILLIHCKKAPPSAIKSTYFNTLTQDLSTICVHSAMIFLILSFLSMQTFICRIKQEKLH